MKINLNTLKEAGYRVEINDEDIIIQPNGRSEDPGRLWQQLHDVISSRLDPIQTEIVLQETVGNIQKHEIVALFDI